MKLRQFARLVLTPFTILLLLGTPNRATAARPEFHPYGITTSSSGPSKWIVPACCVAVAGVCIVKNCKIITTSDECLIERMGKYHRRLGAGWHWIWWPFEQVSYHVTTREQILDIPPQQCYTLDNAPVRADAIVYLKIVNSTMARYNVESPTEAVMNLCLTQLREQVGRLTLDESFSSRDRINKELLRDLNRVCQEHWGILITRVELQNLQPSPDISAAMELQMAAERQKRATILKSEGERMTMINEAEGRASAVATDAEAQRKSIVLAAQAEAERQRLEAAGLEMAIQTVAGAIQQHVGEDSLKARKESVEAAVQFLSLIRYMETQSKFAASDGAKTVILPSKDSLPLTYGGLKHLLD